MHLDPGITTRGDISGWVLVESWLGRRGRHYSCRLVVQRCSIPAEAEEILLPIRPDGRIHEVVRLPDAITSLAWELPESGRFDRPRLDIRRLGWFGRTWRMAYRAVRTYLRLVRDRQPTAGLTPWQVLVNLPGAYRAATELRVRYSYADWIKRFDALRDEDVRAIRAHIERFSGRPHFQVLLCGVDEAGREAVQTTLASLREQIYPNFTCNIVGAYESAPDAPDARLDLRVAAGEAIPDWLKEFNLSLARQAEAWVMLVRAGDALPAHALYWFACEALARPEAAIVYSDDDAVDAEGRRSHPRFKPDWSLAHLRSTHYLGEAVVLRGAAVAAAGGVSHDCCRHGNYDLLLRVIDGAGERVAHVPAVLLHRRYDATPGGEPALHPGGRTEPLPLREKELDSTAWQGGALQAHLLRNAIDADVLETIPGCRRVRYRLPENPPLVSVIVPTRDALALIRQCVKSLLEKTTYPCFEILVVDNQSADPQALEYLGRIATYPAVRVLRYDRPFNFSAINNFAAREARGAVLCLLNNDTEVITPDWLEEMVGHLLQPRVGVTGAKLYYPDGRVQHAGDAVGPGGCANHLHSSIDRDDPGYCNRAAVAQELSAVTAACVVTWRELYLKLGGLDEQHLEVAFNDVDYCLRVRAAGYRVVWTPHAGLYHHESVSRGADRSRRRRSRAKREVVTMRRRWAHVMRHDPFYNPNLSYERPDFSLSRAPRVKKPWLEEGRS